MRIRIGSHVTLHPTAEQGTNRYTVGESPDPAGRVDDATVYGGFLEFRLGTRVTVGTSWSRSRYDSNIDANDRSYNQFGVTLTLGRNLLQ